MHLRKTVRVGLGFAACLLLSGALAVPAFSQPSGTVGLRVDLPSVDASMRTVDLELTMYTRGGGPYGVAGRTDLGIPAIEWGDGETVATVPMALTAVGTGPGGSNVYRSATFSHTYPAGPEMFTVRAGMSCVDCDRGSFVFFPSGSPPPATFTQTQSNLPTQVLGNLAAMTSNSGTVYLGTFSTSARYLAETWRAVTETAQVLLPTPVTEIPTISEWGMLILGAFLLLAGIRALRAGGM